MGCTDPRRDLIRRGPEAEWIAGLLPGQGACGCGCVGADDTVGGALPGLGVPSAVGSVAWSARADRSGRRGRLVAAEGASVVEAQDAARIDTELAALGDHLLADLILKKSGLCTFLAPPPVSEWGACGAKLEGSDEACDWLACEEHRALPDLADLATRAVPVDLKDERAGRSDCEAQLSGLIRAAWALLQDNDDLVSWATCWTFGRTRSNGILYALRGWFDEDVEIVISGDVGDPPGQLARARTGTRITVLAGEDYWQVLLAVWCCGRNPDMACAALDAACVLYHELTHYSDISEADGDYEDGVCYNAYVAESVFRWAMFGRYDTLDELWYRESDATGTSYSRPCCHTLVSSDRGFAVQQPKRAHVACRDEASTDCSHLPAPCGESPCV